MPVASSPTLRANHPLKSVTVGKSHMVKARGSSVITQAASQGFGTDLTRTTPSGKALSKPAYNGVFLLLLLNCALYAADHLGGMPVSKLYLNHWSPKWYQFLTSAFCHASWQHLSGNAFLLLIFGRNVEEEEGAFGVIASYIFCALGANVASYFMMPRNVHSLGASGAVFGLFVVAVLSKISWSPRKLLESVILGQFVVSQVINEAKMQFGTQGMTIAGAKVGHLAHLFGALAGVLLVFLLSRLPVPAEGK